MSGPKPSWRDLNAYADGELSAAQAAGVACAVAEDPDLAREVAALARLKATVQEEGRAQIPAGLTELSGRAEGPDATAQRRRGNGPRPVWRVLGGLAAALALVVLGAALLYSPEPQPERPAWLDFAQQLHEDWAGTVGSGGGMVGPGEPTDQTTDSAGDLPTADHLLASLSRLGPAAMVPDLSSARLTVGYLRPLSSAYGEGLHVGYRGTRGCRVSLIIMDGAGNLPETPTALGGGPERHAWRVGRLGYVLMASGMDPQHYAVILETVHRASRSAEPIGPETRTALRTSRSRARPCAA